MMTTSPLLAARYQLCNSATLILELPEPHRERSHWNRLRRPSRELLFPAVDENRGFVLMRKEAMELLERDNLTGRHGLSRFDLDRQIPIRKRIDQVDLETAAVAIEVEVSK
jgi:hypothetical protein